MPKKELFSISINTHEEDDCDDDYSPRSRQLPARVVDDRNYQMANSRQQQPARRTQDGVAYLTKTTTQHIETNAIDHIDKLQNAMGYHIPRSFIVLLTAGGAIYAIKELASLVFAAVAVILGFALYQANRKKQGGGQS